MLAASARWKIGASAELRSTFVLGRGLRAQFIERRGLVFDTRFAPERFEPTTQVAIALVVAGTVDVFSPSSSSHAGPFGWLASEDAFESVKLRRSFSFRSGGAPYAALELRVGRHEVLAPLDGCPTCFALDEVACELVTSALPSRNAAPQDARRALDALLDWLVRREVLRHGAADRALPFERVWQALAPLTAQFNLLRTLQEVSAHSGFSLRQIARDVDGLRSALGMVEGWRETTRRYRLTLAVVGLSAADASIGEVAEAVGYGSVDAMARAFRDASLPSPSVVRQRVLDASP